MPRSPSPPKSSLQDEAETSGGRRARKKERTRRQIYTAAMALFAKGGFYRVTVEQICSEADVARGTFFAHFPTKASLLWEFSQVMAAEFRSRHRDRPTSAAAELQALCTLLADAWLKRAEVMSSMLREFLATPAVLLEAPREAAAERTGLPALIEEIFERGQRTGEFRQSIKPRLAATIVLSTALAILSGGVFEVGEVTPDEVREQFFEVVLHGLVAS